MAATPTSSEQPFVTSLEKFRFEKARACYCCLMWRLSLIGIVLCLFTVLVPAQVPQTLSYQGRILAAGTNFNGAGRFKFALVSGEAAQTVTHWSNDGTSSAGGPPLNAVKLTVNTGLFQVLLGDLSISNMAPIPPTVFGTAGIKLRIWFGAASNVFEQLTPDQPLGAAGYAMFAANFPSAQINAGTIFASNAITTSGTITAADHLGSGRQLTNVFDRLTGQRNLYRVWERLRQGKGFNALFVGDSLIAGSMETLGNADLRQATLRFFGTNGAFGNAGGHGNLGPNFVTQIPPTRDGVRWFGQFYLITNNGSLLFFPNVQDGFCKADRFTVPYLVKPGNGVLTIKSVTPTTTNILAVINTSLPTNSYATNFIVPLDRYRLRFEAAGGECEIIAPGMWEANATGVRWGWIGENGVDNWETGYHYWTNAIKAYAPDFVGFLQTGGGPDVAIRGAKAGWALFIQDTVKNLWPNADVVVSAVYPIADPNTLNGQHNVLENRILRDFCATNGWMFFDAFNLSPSWAEANTMGWFRDPVHYGPAYVSYLCGLLGRQLGWFDTTAVSFFSGGQSPWSNTTPWLRSGENAYFPSNPIASWPKTPRTPGEAFIGNSNGVLYILTSAPGLPQWVATNKLAP